MLLLALGLMLLNAQHRQLDNALLLAADQQRYLQAYNQAASALSWGISQRWPRAELSAAALVMQAARGADGLRSAVCQSGRCDGTRPWRNARR